MKPILKVMQENFSAQVHTAYIIKPDNFWQKQRTSMGSQKYRFEVSALWTYDSHQEVDTRGHTAATLS